VPSTEELIKRNLSLLESSLNQNTPEAEKAFNHVLAAVLGMAAKGLYTYAADLARENLALTASEEGLTTLGKEYGIPRGEPAAWEGESQFVLAGGKTLYVGTVFIGQQGLKYETTSSVTNHSKTQDTVTVPIVCCEVGTEGNVSTGAVLTIQTPLPGSKRTLIVTKITSLGAPAEDIELYRQHILDFERSEGGGGNSSDYRSWAQAVPGVRRAYPLTGVPVTSSAVSLPGDRTVYIEALPNIHPDGIAPLYLINEVKNNLIQDPQSGKSRLLLGFSENNLYVESIVRKEIYVTIKGLVVKTGTISHVQSILTTTIEMFLRNGLSPFIQGLDSEFERNDTFTVLHLAREVQNVIEGYGGSVESVLFGLSPSVNITRYTLNCNEKLKLGKIFFVDGVNGENA